MCLSRTTVLLRHRSRDDRCADATCRPGETLRPARHVVHDDLALVDQLVEVEDREVTDTLYYIDYPLESGSGAITVATVARRTSG